MRRRILNMWLNAAGRAARVAALDLALLAFAVYVSFALRLSLFVPPAHRHALLATVAAFPLCVTLVMWVSGIYRVHWPQASVEEYARLARSYVMGVALFLCAYYFSGVPRVPRISLAVMTLSGVVFIGSMRASWRLAGFYSTPHAGGAESRRTIIIGAGEAGAFLARDLLRRGSGFSPVGFIDADPHKRGKTIASLPVLGDDGDIVSVCGDNGVKVALIAIPSASGALVRKYLDALSSLNVEVRVLPSMRELAGGMIEVGSLRSVELRDLLRREPIRLDEAEISSVVSGRRVLVTGAGGSIGSEICEQLARHSPAVMLLLGHGEQSIYNLVQRMGDSGAAAPYRPIIADIADQRAMERVFGEHRPEIVFHAGAHKHVPLMEENPREALRVNSLGTWTLAEQAGACGAERFVMISTDKAVRPSSVMGATKRVAERLMRGVQRNRQSTRYIAVRFGNVLGSRGSVVPLFERQIMKGGPVTVTHPDMRRYFMLIPEAVSLVLQAATMGRGGELYVLDMGEPVNIAEMAETLIRLHGRNPHTEVKIEFTGVRKGEKLFEELFYDPAHVDTTSHEKIFLSRMDGDDVPPIDAVRDILASKMTDRELRDAIFKLAGADSRAE
jgi:FlaA1/EpsC-like NDP-sugar epimerase